MKSILIITGAILVLNTPFKGTAQQIRQTNLYQFNKYSFNPAYAGFSGCTEVNFSHLNQWVKVEGAPLTNFLSANTRIGKSLGIGGNVLLDRAGMLQQFSSSLGLSYGFIIAEEHHLRLGISGGYFQMRVDPEGAIAFDSGDEIIEGGTQAAGTLNTEAGLLYSFKGLELSFSSQQLFESRTNLNYPGLQGYGLKRHLTGYASYDVILSKSLTLKPSIFYKGINATEQFDINIDLNYNDFIYGGLGYRTHVGLVGRIGVNVRKLFFIGYAYEIPMQNIARNGSGSHEIAIGLKFCKKEKEVPMVEVKPDTVRIIEHVIDTLIVERIDTIYIDNSGKPEEVSDAEVNKAMLQASKTLEFENDKAIIRKKSYGDLEALTNLLLIRDELKIRMEGHTDSNGTEAYNLKLSKDRVEAVKAFFVANGIDPTRIETAHYGETKPIADNDTEEGRERNRRVEMKIVQ